MTCVRVSELVSFFLIDPPPQTVMVCLTHQPVFTHLSDVTFSSPSEDLRCMWSVITKAKQSIAQGYRLENLSWRLWYASTKGFQTLLTQDGHLTQASAETEVALSESMPVLHPPQALTSPELDESSASLPTHLDESQLSVAGSHGPSPTEALQGGSPVQDTKPPLSQRILHSLTSVLQEIRDSVHTKRTPSQGQTKMTSSKKTGKEKRARSRDKSGRHQRASSTQPSHARLEQTAQPTMSSSLGSYGSPGASSLALPHKRLTRSDPDPRSLSHRLSRRVEDELSGLEEDTYRVDPNDPAQSAPMTTYPYDDAQFELAHKVLAAMSEDGSLRSNGSLQKTYPLPGTCRTPSQTCSSLSGSEALPPPYKRETPLCFPKVATKETKKPSTKDTSASLLSLLISQTPSLTLSQENLNQGTGPSSLLTDAPLPYPSSTPHLSHEDLRSTSEHEPEGDCPSNGTTPGTEPIAPPSSNYPSRHTSVSPVTNQPIMDVVALAHRSMTHPTPKECKERPDYVTSNPDPSSYFIW